MTRKVILFSVVLATVILCSYARVRNVAPLPIDTSFIEKEEWPPRMTPGLKVSPQQQCQDRNPGYFSNVCQPKRRKDICSDLVCTTSRGDIPAGKLTGPALDGTWCGNQKICKAGKCIPNLHHKNHPFKHFEGIECDYL